MERKARFLFLREPGALSLPEKFWEARASHFLPENSGVDLSVLQRRYLL
jgi:hypothetical protein